MPGLTAVSAGSWHITVWQCSQAWEAFWKCRVPCHSQVQLYYLELCVEIAWA